MRVVKMAGGVRHRKCDFAFSRWRQIVVPPDQYGLSIMHLVGRAGSDAIKSPGPTAFVIRRLRMVLPEKFLLMDFVKLLWQELLVSLVRSRNRRWMKRLLRGLFDGRDIHLRDERS